MRHPWGCGALIGAEEDAVAFLPRIRLAVGVDDVPDLFAVFGVVFHDFRHVFGQEVVMLHRQNGQFQPHHATDFPRP